MTIVFFAQVPPPEHGQSRMVLLALETLQKKPTVFQVHHVNARFSNSLEDIGESSFGKLLLTTKYLAQALRLRFITEQPHLYYVPGPVKWSSVIRDWVILGVLRIFYPRLILHWHAIGHGEWANGSDRLKLDGPKWLDRIARKISAKILHKPLASIAVSVTSQKDTIAIESLWKRVICNGIADPCPDFAEKLAPLRIQRLKEIASTERPYFKILFMSHGTEEKGTLDALDCLAKALELGEPSWQFSVTFAGGISESIRSQFNATTSSLHSRWPNRITIQEEGYLSGESKHRCFIEHDIFLAPSRWESFGLTVIEAMAYNMQIVAAASDGVKGVLPERYPYLAPVASPLQLAEKLRECCVAITNQRNPQNTHELRERFLTLYQIKDFSKNLEQAMLDIGDEVACPSSESIKPPAIKELVHHAPKTRRVDEKVIKDWKAEQENPCGETTPITVTETPVIHLTAYLADQNPGYDRSFGISRMSQIVLDSLQKSGKVNVQAITSQSSQKSPSGTLDPYALPWGTRNKTIRLLTDHFHPLFFPHAENSNIYYYPKGYLPLISVLCRPSVVTIHDTIIQYDEDHYPNWRKPSEYRYWAMMLKHTLRNADRILTVSESSKEQIEDFMKRHRIPSKDITVTYEPCLYENIPQPVDPTKENYVIHLASCEPHKRTAHLIRWWHMAEAKGQNVPMLHLIGNVPPEVAHLLASSHTIVKSPFLEESTLQATYLSARALILPSEIEGFGLPALEAYYLGTPVCFIKGTSVEEILSVATEKGGFSLENFESLFIALDEIIKMEPQEIHRIGLNLRETYASQKVAERMVSVFDEVRIHQGRT